MNTARGSLIPLAGLAALFLFLSPARAQEDYDNGNWLPLAGSTSTGGVYSLEATIGCTDVGLVSGTNYTLDAGGYFRLQAMLTDPELGMGCVIVPHLDFSWPWSEEDWRLFFASSTYSNLMAWIEIPPNLYQTNGATISYSETPSAGARFYRLERR